MIKRTSPVRRHSRFPVRWPVVYRGSEFIAEGTVLDLTRIGWRIAGSMPVTPGMRLSLELSVPDRSEPVRIERAMVLWVKDCEFAIEAQGMTPTDQAWVNEFLYHKLGLPWVSDSADRRKSLQTAEREFQVDADGERTMSGHCEDSMRMLLDQILTQEIEDTVIQRCMAQRGCEEEDARAAYRRFIQEIWQPALGIVSGMLTKKTQQALARQYFIANN